MLACGLACAIGGCATPGALKLSASFDGCRVTARLTNDGKQPVNVHTGWMRHFNPGPLSLTIDGRSVRFNEPLGTCYFCTPSLRSLAHGESAAMLSDKLPTGAHEVAVHYRATLRDRHGEIWSGALDAPAQRMTVDATRACPDVATDTSPP